MHSRTKKILRTIFWIIVLLWLAYMIVRTTWGSLWLVQSNFDRDAAVALFQPVTLISSLET